MKLPRLIILFPGSGIVWYGALNLFFVYSGAQNILANPDKQSSKFLKVFTEYQPLPMMATNPSIVWKGLLLVGFLTALAFSILNPYLKGNWLKRGMVFGFIHWLVMTPWFEFYLPYNVMHEPLSLVLFEAALWLCLTLTLGLFMSFTLNFKRRP
jgi:hypothetical protein